MLISSSPRPPSPPFPSRAAGLPVRRVFCVGRNYAEHAREMGSDRIASRRSFS